MKKLLFCMVLVTITVSCLPSSVITGSGREAGGTFDVSSNYTELRVSSGILVELVPSESGEGFISADEEVLEHLSIVEENGRVKVSYQPFVTVQTDIQTVVTMPLSTALARLDISSGSRVTSARRLLCSSMEIDLSLAAGADISMDAQSLTMSVSGGAVFNGNVVVRNLDVKAGGAAVCNVEGSADNCKVRSDGEARFNGVGLICRRALADASGGGIVEISATGELDAIVSGNGSIRYKGTPVIVRISQSGGGSVKAIM